MSRMRYAVISDVHSNLEALDAVLSDIEKRFEGNPPPVLFLGDAVGYGPDPNECVKLIKETTALQLAGNHDRAVLGLTDIEYFNEYARAAILWTQGVISDESKEILRALPVDARMREEDLYLVHSTPKRPLLWNYLLTIGDAEVNFDYFSERICLLGHSHLPFILERLPTGEMTTHTGKTRLLKPRRYIINAGSVGQPRDGDPRACYAVLDEKSAELIRVPYDIEKTQRKMTEAGLPEFLIERLAQGR